MSMPLHLHYDPAVNKGIVVDIPNKGAVMSVGVTVPTDATPGYLPGCIFHHIDGAAQGTLYVNEGTAASCDFNRLLTSANAQGSALTAQFTTITHTAPGTPDYAIQDLTNSGGFGFATKDEGNSVLKVVANMQTRLAEVEAILEAAGLCVAN